MTQILFRLAVISLGVTLSAYLIPGVTVTGPWPTVKAAILLGLLNISIKPVLIILTLPITLLTLGFFTIVINGLMLWLVGSVIEGFDLAGFPTAVLASLVVSVISLILNQALWPRR